jgi:hypothetical protein
VVYGELPPNAGSVATPAPTEPPQGVVNYSSLGLAPAVTPQF